MLVKYLGLHGSFCYREEIKLKGYWGIYYPVAVTHRRSSSALVYPISMSWLICFPLLFLLFPYFIMKYIQ